MKLYVSVAVVLVVLAAAATVTGEAFAHGKPPASSPYLIAQATMSQSDQWGSSLPVDVAGTTPELGLDCGRLGAHPFLPFAALSPASVGSVLWVDGDTPSFAQFAAAFTDGVNTSMCSGLRWGTYGWSARGSMENSFFGQYVGPSGVDLAGYVVSRIGLRVLGYTAAGSYDPADGLTNYAFTIQGTFLFMGRIASPSACNGNAWRSLRGEDGERFATKQDCVRVAARR